MSHALERTSPKGQEFIGSCTKCGEEGLPMSATLTNCPADGVISDARALIDILNKADD